MGLPDLGHGLRVDNPPTPNLESPPEIRPEGRVDGELERRLARKAGQPSSANLPLWVVEG